MPRVRLYSLLGALHFVPSLRRGRPSWHRIGGRILVPLACSSQSPACG
ncbi:MAG: DUF2306 domain-containing protein [Chloroflexi bacterium]|nr:MAG: DUF2306 domain-containing protein [Chloroflexota bacterium]